MATFTFGWPHWFKSRRPENGHRMSDPRGIKVYIVQYTYTARKCTPHSAWYIIFRITLSIHGVWSMLYEVYMESTLSELVYLRRKEKGKWKSTNARTSTVSSVLRTAISDDKHLGCLTSQRSRIGCWPSLVR